MRYCQETIRLGRAETVNVWNYYNLASLYAYAGENEKAYEMLNLALRDKLIPFQIIWNFKKSDPLFDKIRNEPQFQQIAIELEAKYQEENERVRKWLEEKGEL